MAVGLLAQARSPPFLPCLFPPFLIPSLPSSLFPLPSSLPPFFFLFSFFLPSLYTLFIKQIGFKNHLHTNNGDFKDKYYMIHPDFFFFGSTSVMLGKDMWFGLVSEHLGPKAVTWAKQRYHQTWWPDSVPCASLSCRSPRVFGGSRETDQRKPHL